MTELTHLIEAHGQEIVNWRRSLHQIPETGFTEVKTSSFVAEKLLSFGLDVKTGIAKTGVVGQLSGTQPADTVGKTILLRSDMDALPIKEETGLPFASTHESNMHACGHDGHMAMVLATAKVMSGLKDKFNGTVKFVFQPAEEGPGGAKPMIEAGVMENPQVNFSMGAHLWPSLPEGTVGVKDGALMAAMDFFDLTIYGKGGHGAMPHMCIDPIDTGVQAFNALQRIVSRRMNPLNPTVVTIGKFHGGSTYNIIPDSVELSGTTRTFDRDVWLSWPKRLEEVIHGICNATGANYELSYRQGYPPTLNDPEMANLARQCAVKVVGDQNVVVPEATMGGEDMSYYLEASKGCYLFLGVGREGSVPLHNCKFDFNEEVLLTGVEIYCRMILELLG